LNKKVESFVERLNNFTGALLLAATVGLAGNAVASIVTNGGQDIRLSSLEKFQEQQYEINKSVIQLSETVAVMGERQANVTKALENLK
jgi:hypothetical protein